MLPDFSKTFKIYTDDSVVAIGVVLMQDTHLIEFKSHNINVTERRYKGQEKELTIIMHYLRIWRRYIIGSKFMVKTDNVATRYFYSQKNITPK